MPGRFVLAIEYDWSMSALVELSTGSAIEAKQDQLFELLRQLDRVIVAYSGGTDSAYLAWAASRVLGAKAIAITADSASIPASHKRDAEDFVRSFRIRHEYVETHEFENPDYLKNDPNRCFHCKDELFTVLEKYGAELGYSTIVYGVNRDDLGDYRPGQRAAKLHQVKAPLVDANLNKAESGNFPGWLVCLHGIGRRPRASVPGFRMERLSRFRTSGPLRSENRTESPRISTVPDALSWGTGEDRDCPGGNAECSRPGDGPTLHGNLQKTRL